MPTPPRPCRHGRPPSLNAHLAAGSPPVRRLKLVLPPNRSAAQAKRRLAWGTACALGLLLTATLVLALARRKQLARGDVPLPSLAQAPATTPYPGQARVTVVGVVAPTTPNVASRSISPRPGENSPAPDRGKAVTTSPAKEEKLIAKRRQARTEEELLQELEDAPLLALDRTAKRAESNLAATLRQPNATLALLDHRADLAGLPLRRGSACRLTPSAAASLDEDSAALRRTGLSGNDAKFGRWTRRAAIPAMMQILTGEGASNREALAEQLSRIEGRAAAEALARLALFDLHPRVRERAIAALAPRPVWHYLPALLEGFEYPWPVAADHAAEALVALDRKDAVPALVGLLGRPDPRAPYARGGRGARLVKELARVNHQQNCLLCHAPSFSTSDMVRGRVPQLNETPSTGPEYYRAEPQGGTFVRADITYLKQDFSALLKVAESGRRTDWQRFDFFVRERFATEEDLRLNAMSEKAGPGRPQQAAIFALQQLTGLDPAPALADWKNLALGRRLEVRLRQRGFRGATALAVDEQGRAYVAEGRWILRQEGNANAEPWLDGGEAPPWGGLALDRNGRLLGVRLGGDAGKPSEGPLGIAVDGSGGVYFGDEPGADPRGGGVLYLSAVGSVRKTTALPGRVAGLGLSPDGTTLYVAQGNELRGYAITSPGSLGRTGPVGRLTSRGDKAEAVGLAVDGRGLIYVANGPARLIEVFGPDGTSRAYAALDEPPVACAIRGGELYVLTRTALYTVEVPAEATLVAAR